MHPIIKKTLLETGLPFREIPKAGGSQIELKGKLVGHVPKNGDAGDRRTVLNVRAQIRRAAKEMKNEK